MLEKTRPSWQECLRSGFSQPHDLLTFLELPHQHTINTSFALKIPRQFAEKIERNNPQDPILLQVLPNYLENKISPNFNLDPVDDLNSIKIPGLLHKYSSRVLLTLTGACGIHCRYCFRKNFPYEENNLSNKNIENILNYLQNNNKISEIILSGGDPLVLSDSKLIDFLQKLENINHITTIRIHSRLMAILPQRVTQALVDYFSKSRFSIILVTHINHPNEIDDFFITKFLELKKMGIVLLNQSVLLNNINNNLDILINLSKKLFQAGILPYYLNALDKVQGTEHFYVDDKFGIKLINQMRDNLPGYLVPRFVRDIPGKSSKTVLG